MITKVVPKKGSRTRGLLEYLWGPGEANEHENPRIVAAWDATFVQDADAPAMDSFERGLLAREMEAPLRMFDQDPGKHVYHVPVSIHAHDGELSDEQWAEVATRAAEELGFTETAERAAVPWIAMRHGRSSDGNDHIHFVASLYRESGHVPNTHNDFKKWRTVRDEFDHRWNLTTGRERGAGMPGLTKDELSKADREGQTESPRTRLERTVRAAATSARSEADFVRRVRRSGTLIRPRWQQGGRTHVTGYSVALRPEQRGYKPVWFGGGKLAGDLSLERLRSQWESSGSEQRADDLREWRPPGWRQMPTGRQLTQRRLRAEAWQEATSVTDDVRQQLAELPVTDTAAWADVARSTSGTLAALAARVEHPKRSDLRRAASSLARVAQAPRRERARSPHAVVRPLAGVARAVTDAHLASRGGAVATTSLVMQLGRIVRQVEEAGRANGRASQARFAANAAEHMLEHVRRSSRPGEPAPLERDSGARPRPHYRPDRDRKDGHGRTE